MFSSDKYISNSGSFSVCTEVETYNKKKEEKKKDQENDQEKKKVFRLKNINQFYFPPYVIVHLAIQPN